MRIPSKIKIGGFTYDIQSKPNLARDSDASGQSCWNKLSMVLDDSMPRENRESTFIHEIFEQINHVFNVDLEHHQIYLLEAGLYQVIKDNPQIFKEE